MTTTDSRWRSLALGLGMAVVLLAGLAGSPGGNAVAQDAGKPKKDDALDDLLKDLKAEKDARTPKESRSEKPAAKPDAPAAKSGSAKPDARPATTRPEGDKAKPKGDLAPKDKDLDSLLEKLGETKDAPSPDERQPSGPPSGGEEKDKSPKPGEGQGPSRKSDTPDPGLSGKSRDLDEHLEELTGRRRKKPGQDKSEGDGEGSGPLKDVIKEMRDVEQRLGKTDTGEETRKKQQQIVKNLETLIEQMRAESSKSQGQQKKQLAMKGGKQPGQKPGETPGSNPGGAPSSKPEKPTRKGSLAGGKDEWGHLPPELRQEMENVFREEFLPAREELIRRYYDSVARKNLKRGE